MLKLITPEMAAHLLQKPDPNNRPLDWNKVKKYAALIKQNKFDYKDSISSIELNHKNQITNGQHRLQAIIAANKPLKVNIVTKNAKEDIHTKRSTKRK